MCPSVSTAPSKESRNVSCMPLPIGAVWRGAALVSTAERAFPGDVVDDDGDVGGRQRGGGGGGGRWGGEVGVEGRLIGPPFGEEYAARIERVRREGVLEATFLGPRRAHAV